MRKAESGFCDELEIHQLFERSVMRWPEVLDCNLPLIESGGEICGLDRTPIQKALNRLAGGWLRRASVIRFQFKPVEYRRVVACGDHDAADRPLMLDRKRNRRRRRRFWRQQHPETVADEDFGRAPGEGVGKKSPVVTNNHFVLCARRRIGPPFQAGWTSGCLGLE